MNSTGKNNALFPHLRKDRLNTGDIEKSILGSGMQSKHEYNIINKGNIYNLSLILYSDQLSTTVGTAGHNTGINWNDSFDHSSGRIIGKRITLDKYGFKHHGRSVTFDLLILTYRLIMVNMACSLVIQQIAANLDF